MFVKQWIAEQTDKPVEHNAVDEPSTPRKNQKVGLGIALGITLLALLVGVFFLVQSVLARRRSKERTLNKRRGGETEKSSPRESLRGD